MKTKLRIIAGISILVLLLTACGSKAVTKPERTDESVVRVSTPAELLAALTPGEKVIELAAGVYDVSDPSVMPQNNNPHVRWEEVYDGYELILDGMDGVTLRGRGEVIISASPRYANVLTLENTEGFTLKNITLGHTVEPGQCAGGVVRLVKDRDVLIDGCDLYGCGIQGVQADSCTAVTVNDSDIYDCSWQAATISCCEDVRFTHCDIHDCGGGSGNLIQVSATVGFAAVNCDIEDNSESYFLSCDYCRGVSILGCELEDNAFYGAVFMLQGESPVVDGCGFSKNVFSAWYDSMNSNTPGVWAVSPEGEALGRNELEKMEQHDCTYSGYEVNMPQVELSVTVNADGKNEVHVTTVDELLSAIADNTVIYLDSPMYDLSKASDYGWGIHEKYSWCSCYDGNELHISGVEGLTIVGDGAVISAVPRYANVLVFDSCRGITLKGITVGHTELPGECSGGVIYLNRCTRTVIDSCRLYGCGTVGINASEADGITAVDTEIFDCSYNAVSTRLSEDINFTRCNIHDCGTPEIITDRSFSFDGTEYLPGSYHMENGVPTAPKRLCLSIGDRLFTHKDDGPSPVIELGSGSQSVVISVKTESGEAFDATSGWWYVDSGDLYYEVNADGTLTLYPQNSTPGISAGVYFGSGIGDAAVTVRVN